MDERLKEKIKEFFVLFFLVLSIVVAIIGTVDDIKNNDSGFWDALGNGVFGGFLLGGIIPGVTHLPSVVRKLRGIAVLSAFGGPVGTLIFFALALMFCVFAGSIFLIIDFAKIIVETVREKKFKKTLKNNIADRQNEIQNLDTGE